MNEFSRWFDRLRMSIAILENVDFDNVRPKIILESAEKSHGVWMWYVSVEAFVPSPGKGFGSREVKYRMENCQYGDVAYALMALYEDNLRKIADKYGVKPPTNIRLATILRSGVGESKGLA